MGEKTAYLVYAQTYPKRHDNTLQQNHVQKEELDDVKHNLTENKWWGESWRSQLCISWYQSSWFQDFDNSKKP